MRKFVPHQAAAYMSVLEAVLDYLYKFDTERLKEQRSILLSKQTSLMNTFAIAIDYKGSYITNWDAMSAVRAQAPETRQAPHPDLVEEVHRYTAMAKQIEDEQLNLRQSLVVALRRCNDQQDIRDMLPDCVMKALPTIHCLERSRPVGFLFQHSPALLERYNKTVQHIEAMTVINLVY